MLNKGIDSTVLLVQVAVIYCLFSCSAYGKSVMPKWINDEWRNDNYPSSEWYVGFSQDALKSKSNVAESIKRIERDAQSKLSESIIVRISGVSAIKETSQQVRQNGNTQSLSNTDFQQNIQAITNTELNKMFIGSHYNEQANRIYAFAAVRKSDLVDYYASKIEFALNEAQRGIDLSKQLLEHHKKKEAQEKLDYSKKIIDSTAYYRALLATVDTQNGIKYSQSERINKLLNEIAIVQAGLKNKTGEIIVFVTGTENIIVSGLQAILSENDIAVTENEKEASFFLTIDAKICNTKFDGRFHYANACVKASLTNVKTSKNEALIIIDNPKGGGLTIEKAGEDAFRFVAAEVWTKIKEKF